MFDATRTEITVEQNLEILRELLLDVSRAMLDIRVGVQRLYDKYRQAQSMDAGILPEHGLPPQILPADDLVRNRTSLTPP